MSAPQEGGVFSPWNAEKTMRLTFPQKDVKVISGGIHRRGRGVLAVVEIYGVRYAVYGMACGLPDCMCDAFIKPVKA